MSLYLIGGIWLSDLGNSAYWPLPDMMVIRLLAAGQHMQISCIGGNIHESTIV